MQPRTMVPRIAYTADLYRINTGLFRRATELLDIKDIDHRPLDIGNSFRFLAGHITFYRHKIATTMGIKTTFRWTELFDLGARPQEPAAYPSLDQIITSFNKITDPMLKRLETIADGELDGAPSFTVQVPGTVNTVGGIISFGALHEAYHVGQMAYLVRLLGGDRLIR
ncbi:MAG: DinB family protein [Candidatus Zixiibacteriota bacterium]